MTRTVMHRRQDAAAASSRCRRPYPSPRLFAALLAAAALSGLATGPAAAQCFEQEMEGRWVNVDPDTRGITRADLRFVCPDVVRNGELPDSLWSVHLWGQCHPDDCDWGTVYAPWNGSDWIVASYDHGFARRKVYVTTSSVYADRLWVFIRTDFVSPSRADYSASYYLRRAAPAMP